MGVLGALFAGVSGLDVYSQAIEVIGNNIANANSPGFKGSRAEFADILARSLTGSAGGNQIGRGVQLAGVTQQFTQGSFETTSSGTDLAIDGRGFFIVSNPDGIFYTRAGLFSIDSEGFLVNGRADKVQGVTLDASGNPSGTLQDLNLTVTNNPPKATTKAGFVANLDARAASLGAAGTATSGSGVETRFQFLTGVNDVIEWNDGVADRTASLITNGGLISGAQNDATAVATAIKTALEATNGGAALADTYTVSYSTTTKKFTITNDTGGSGLGITLRHSVATSTASDDLGFSTASNDAIAKGSSTTSDNQVQFNVVTGRNQFTITLDGAFYVPARTVTVTAGGFTGDGLAQAIEAAINNADQSDQVNRIRSVRVTYNSGSNVNRFQIVSQSTGGERTINIPSDSNSFTIPPSSISVTEGTLGVLGTTNLSVSETFAFTLGLNDNIVASFGGGADTNVSLITHGGLTNGTVVTAQQVASAIKAGLELQNGTLDVYAVTYDSATDRFTVTNNAGNVQTLNLRWTQAASTAAATLGFSTAADDLIAVAGSTTSDTSLTTALSQVSSLNVNGSGEFTVNDPSNLQSSTFSTSIILFDSLGSSHSLNVFFRKIGENMWEYNGIMLGRDLVGPTPDGSNEQALYGRLWFNNTGGLDIEDKFTGNLINGVTFPRANRFNFSGGAVQNQLVDFDFGNSITTDASLQGGLDGVTQFAGSSAVINQTQDGFTTGTLISVSVNRNGNITGQFTNGQTRDLARIILANFNAPGGLSNVGNSLFAETQGSGQPILGQATTAGFGVVLANSVEISNVDIAEEFVRLIRDQQAFQANARVISTTSRLLDEVVNLTR
ncbi:MAG: flagellar hook-basal body complex protein [Candidatus Tectomicrobia bacterium]|uniref:Flagellar hook protein FlgE n=1 Tax=Tectimicrobiota bacterium TaxID=2528274 RepID=A0A932MRD8_UNCTE|nr:flagellar hook-basal body complex protein [Candidatus Tectomicrobia bacterium]